MTAFSVTVCAILFSTWALYKVLTFSRREKNLPPGPPTIPVLGNAHLIPSKGLHMKFKEWADKYGSIYSLKIGRTTMIVLCDREAVFELLNRKGAQYNNRPPDKQVDAALNHEILSMMYEGPLWRAQRKIFSTYFSPTNLDTVLQPVQVAEISQLMADLLTTPQSFHKSVKRTIASISTIILYGHRAPDMESFWGSAVYRSVDEVNKAITPGTYFPSNHFPLLTLLPDRWNMPLQQAKESYQNISSIWAEARERVEERRRTGDKRESLMDQILDEDIVPDINLSYSQMNNFFGTIQMGASDSTSGHTLTSILFLAQNPHCQEKAREELHKVCGLERLPQWSDFDKLPYISCIVKEGLRMRAAIPTGGPHYSNQDNWYKGMLIPKDSVIMVPPTAINFDELYNASPSQYNPDRFLKIADKLAPELASSASWVDRDHYTYGVGRRICPGMHLAERNQWRIMAQLLWAFRIERDAELDTSYDMYDEGLLHFVKDFKVRSFAGGTDDIEREENAPGDAIELMLFLQGAVLALLLRLLVVLVL
ncbi:hypothetical protein FANTH_13879 [Fusarium anthophilum]|uniref:Cytochrome P450 n=1 Tax=Fusarium anthophilum TaxID=48485 RepID=A0A8H4YLH0_9HYPO|nr:hypothetical protein FANTH_13879 [Fusarium anthophilum]